MMPRARMLEAIASMLRGGVVRTFFSERFSFASGTVWVIVVSIGCPAARRLAAPQPDTLSLPLSFPVSGAPVPALVRGWLMWSALATLEASTSSRSEHTFQNRGSLGHRHEHACFVGDHLGETADRLEPSELVGGRADDLDAW